MEKSLAACRTDAETKSIDLPLGATTASSMKTFPGVPFVGDDSNIEK